MDGGGSGVARVTERTASQQAPGEDGMPWIDCRALWQLVSLQSPQNSHILPLLRLPSSSGENAWMATRRSGQQRALVIWIWLTREITISNKQRDAMGQHSAGELMSIELRWAKRWTFSAVMTCIQLGFPVDSRIYDPAMDLIGKVVNNKIGAHIEAIACLQIERLSGWMDELLGHQSKETSAHLPPINLTNLHSKPILTRCTSLISSDTFVTIKDH